MAMDQTAGTMYWEQDQCPECGMPPAGTIDTCPGLALLKPEETGGFSYAGITDYETEEQRTQRDEDGRDSLMCENRHVWYSLRLLAPRDVPRVVIEVRKGAVTKVTGDVPIEVRILDFDTEEHRPVFMPLTLDPTYVVEVGSEESEDKE
ncbi:hypothetical protein LCGC14_2072550 [marine sediment metagenome]|uniref:Uncharacterized protein n=1 Tax=marine sediment metagenome TaxID=412755 RepID=A0A0F9EHU6_9ZZZZ